MNTPPPNHQREPAKVKASVYADGTLRAQIIDGLNIKRLRPVEDHRGHIVEMFSEAWGMTQHSVPYAYHVTLRSGSIRAWLVHKEQEDRIFISRGTLLWAFFDDRVDSKTRNLLNVFTFSEENRALFIIPPGVYHGVKNIGEQASVFINMPSKPYNHSDPDKYRLPLKNDLIPFDFDEPPLA